MRFLSLRYSIEISFQLLQVSEGISRDILDINESSLYFDCPWREEQQQPSAAAAAQSSRPYSTIPGSDLLMAYGPNPTAAAPTMALHREEHSTGSSSCCSDIESMASLLPGERYNALVRPSSDDSAHRSRKAFRFDFDF